jgi:hypothetical protein
LASQNAIPTARTQHEIAFDNARSPVVASASRRPEDLERAFAVHDLAMDAAETPNF